MQSTTDRSRRGSKDSPRTTAIATSVPSRSTALFRAGPTPKKTGRQTAVLFQTPSQAGLPDTQPFDTQPLQSDAAISGTSSGEPIGAVSTPDATQPLPKPVKPADKPEDGSSTGMLFALSPAAIRPLTDSMLHDIGYTPASKIPSQPQSLLHRTRTFADTDTPLPCGRTRAFTRKQMRKQGKAAILASSSSPVMAGRGEHQPSSGDESDCGLAKLFGGNAGNPHGSGLEMTLTQIFAAEQSQEANAAGLDGDDVGDGDGDPVAEYRIGAVPPGEVETADDVFLSQLDGDTQVLTKDEQAQVAEEVRAFHRGDEYPAVPDISSSESDDDATIVRSPVSLVGASATSAKPLFRVPMMVERAVPPTTVQECEVQPLQSPATPLARSTRPGHLEQDEIGSDDEIQVPMTSSAGVTPMSSLPSAKSLLMPRQVSRAEAAIENSTDPKTDVDCESESEPISSSPPSTVKGREKTGLRSVNSLAPIPSSPVPMRPPWPEPDSVSEGDGSQNSRRSDKENDRLVALEAEKQPSAAQEAGGPRWRKRRSLAIITNLTSDSEPLSTAPEMSEQSRSDGPVDDESRRDDDSSGPASPTKSATARPVQSVVVHKRRNGDKGDDGVILVLSRNVRRKIAQSSASATPVSPAAVSSVGASSQTPKPEADPAIKTGPFVRGEPASDRAGVIDRPAARARVFARFRGHEMKFYPATCIGHSHGHSSEPGRKPSNGRIPSSSKSATVRTASASLVRVRFDDGTEDDVDHSLVRPLHFTSGDTVRVDKAGMRSRTYSVVSSDEALLSTQTAGDSESEMTDILGRRNVVLTLNGVPNSNPKTGKKSRRQRPNRKADEDGPIRVPISAIYLTSNLWSRFSAGPFVLSYSADGITAATVGSVLRPSRHDRVSGSPLAGHYGAAVSPLSISGQLSVGQIRSPAVATPTCRSSNGRIGVFSNMAIAVSHTRVKDRDRIQKLIVDHGGTVIESSFYDMFGGLVDCDSGPPSKKIKRKGGASQLQIPTHPRHPVPGISSPATPGEEQQTDRVAAALSGQYQSLVFAAVVADKPSRRVKYMGALSLGLPCLSIAWVLMSVKAGRALPYSNFLLPAGESVWAGGMRSLTVRPCSDGALLDDPCSGRFVSSLADRFKPLEGCTILIVRRSCTDKLEAHVKKLVHDGESPNQVAGLSVSRGSSQVGLATTFGSCSDGRPLSSLSASSRLSELKSEFEYDELDDSRSVAGFDRPVRHDGSTTAKQDRTFNDDGFLSSYQSLAVLMGARDVHVCDGLEAASNVVVDAWMRPDQTGRLGRSRWWNCVVVDSDAFLLHQQWVDLVKDRAVSKSLANSNPPSNTETAGLQIPGKMAGRRPTWPLAMIQSDVIVQSLIFGPRQPILTRPDGYKAEVCPAETLMREAAFFSGKV